MMGTESLHLTLTHGPRRHKRRRHGELLQLAVLQEYDAGDACVDSCSSAINQEIIRGNELIAQRAQDLLLTFEGRRHRQCAAAHLAAGWWSDTARAQKPRPTRWPRHHSRRWPGGTGGSEPRKEFPPYVPSSEKRHIYILNDQTGLERWASFQLFKLTGRTFDRAELQSKSLNHCFACSFSEEGNTFVLPTNIDVKLLSKQRSQKLLLPWCFTQTQSNSSYLLCSAAILLRAPLPVRNSAHI